jgi:glycosyltransferase involved in cell wall biosynthesis
MQARVARRIGHLTTVSESSRSDVVTAFGVDPTRVRVIEVGVDPEVFAPPSAPRTPGRLVAVASADVPLKGVEDLVEAVAKLATERDVELVVVGSVRAAGATDRAIDRLGVRHLVQFVSGLSDGELAGLLSSAQVAVVPSRYEGFSLPAVEAMATATALVTTSAGALPEVTGPDGLTALHAPPGDPAALASAIGRLLDDEGLRERLGAAGRARVLERYTWRRTAERTAAWYTDVLGRSC